uniref:Uncharacterized protein n=1 Tax=Anguilla anguilla TaxID=7936 RepID=A0A0E9RJN9_ANGAN
MEELYRSFFLGGGEGVQSDPLLILIFKPVPDVMFTAVVISSVANSHL